MGRPVEFGGKLEFLEFSNAEAQDVFWHSSSHIMGEALERLYGGNLTKGPPTESGFFYDIFLGDKVVNEESYRALDDMMKKITEEKQSFERILISKQDGLELFKVCLLTIDFECIFFFFFCFVDNFALVFVFVFCSFSITLSRLRSSKTRFLMMLT
jgi:hypothetical protein